MSMLTTTDNPFDPFTQRREWYAWDLRAGYNTPGLLARMVDEISAETPDADEEETIEAAIDRIVDLNASGVHRKVSHEDESDGEPMMADEDEDLETEDDEAEADDVEDLDEEDEADKVDDAEWAEILAEMGEELSRAVGDNKLKNYWTKGKGLKRWAGHPHPWTRLRNLLRKHVGPGRAERIASQWFHSVFGYWPGHRKGKNPVGPG